MLRKDIYEIFFIKSYLKIKNSFPFFNPHTNFFPVLTSTFSTVSNIYRDVTHPPHYLSWHTITYVLQTYISHSMQLVLKKSRKKQVSKTWLTNEVTPSSSSPSHLIASHLISSDLITQVKWSSSRIKSKLVDNLKKTLRSSTQFLEGWHEIFSLFATNHHISLFRSTSQPSIHQTALIWYLISNKPPLFSEIKHFDRYRSTLHVFSPARTYIFCRYFKWRKKRGT